MSEERPTGKTVPPESAYFVREGRLPPRAWITTGVALTVGLFVGYSLGSDSVPPAPWPPPPDMAIAEPTETSIPGDGTFWVGHDVSPGLYHSYGNAQCNWSRATDASGERIAQLASDSLDGYAYVQLVDGEFFSTQNCSTWERITDGTADH